MPNQIRTHSRTAKLSSSAHLQLEVLFDQLLALWNQGLEWRKSAWEISKVSVSCYDQQAALTKLRQSHPKWRVFPAIAQRSILERLDRSYKRFFKQGGYPRFKSLDRGIRSFELSLPPKVKSTGKHFVVQIKGVGSLKFTKALPKGEIKKIRVVKTPRRVKLQFVMEQTIPSRIDTRAPVGIDVGIKSRITCSDGFQIPKNTLNRRELKRRQRRFSRAKPNGNNQQKKKLAVAKQWQKTTEQEHGVLHELTSTLIKEVSTRFYVEDLNIPNMVKNKYLARSILEQQWGTFLHQLDYKAASAGGWLKKVPPQNTTQQCSQCGHLPEKKIGLNQRTYHCSLCGLSMDRDLNAAINILHKGQALDSAGHSAETLADENKSPPTGEPQRRTVSLTTI